MPPPVPVFPSLAELGLNLQAVLDVAALPAGMRAALRVHLPASGGTGQLILIGNAGPALWREVKAAGVGGDDPIDDFSVRTVTAWFAEHFPAHRHCLLYPGDSPIGLQALGALAGWHHATPFKVGILPGWGSWFGYRVVLWADTVLPPTAPLEVVSPCVGCAARPCVAACPAQAMDAAGFALDKCLTWRLLPDSPCRGRCLARDACPEGREYRYDEDHMRHTYGQSLRMIVRRG